MCFEVCTIHVKPDSLGETAVMFPLERSDKDRLLPFFVVENPAPPLLSEASSSTDFLMEPPIFASLKKLKKHELILILWQA